MKLSNFVSNATLVAVMPLLLSAGLLYRSGSCIRKDNQVYLEMHKSDLSPLFVSSGLFAGGLGIWQLREMGQKEQVNKFMPVESFTNDVANDMSVTSSESTDDYLVRSQPSLNFFQEVFFNADGSEKAFHAVFNGITGDGKTTLAEELIKILAKENQVYLVNPKHLVSQPEWNYQPVCTSIDQALVTLNALEKLMTDRLNDPDFDVTKTPINYIVIDELDWICSHFKKKATDAIRNLLKVSRSVNFRVILCGQTSLVGGTYFNSSDFRQTNRFILGSEALAFLNNPQLAWDGSIYRQTAEQWQKEGKRFVFVIPTKGKPFLQLLPYINRQIIKPLISAPNLFLAEKEVDIWAA
jgi:hypothetical protein